MTLFNVRNGLLGLFCLFVLTLTAGCSTTVEAQQNRFDRAIDNLEIVGTKQPMKKAGVTAKIVSFKAERDKIVAGAGDQKTQLARLSSRVESYTNKLSPTLGTTTTGPVGSKLARPTTTSPPGQPTGIARPGVVPGRIGAPGVATGKLGAPGVATGRLGAPGMAPGKLGAPGMVPGKLGAPGMVSGKLGAPGMAAGTLGAPGAMNRRVGVYLVSPGLTKISVMKVIRHNTNLGLREAKTIIDTPNAAVKIGLTMAEANALRAQLTAAGAQVTIR